MLTTIFTFPSLLPGVNATDVAITSITPSLKLGNVGDAVRIIGTINTTDGVYRIWFANINVSETIAVGNAVNTTFNVPVLPKGNYTITLQDVEKNRNATTWFLIEPAYYIKAITKIEPPKQLQENSSITIQVNVTGGESNTIYHANVSVRPPTPRNETYWRVTQLNTTNDGSGNAVLVYPNSFSGTPNTNFVGVYTVAFNKTATTALATDTFTIGLTNSTEYHRRQSVGIKAVGYHANESVTIKITSSGKTIHPTLNVNATQEGLVLANWAVPENASIGTYIVNITSTWLPPDATKKIPADTQGFTVPGFDVNITTKNLAKEIVQGVAVKAFENSKSIVNATSNSNGLAAMKLEIGNYKFEAFYKGAKVYEDILNVTEAASFTFNCTLTNLKISVYTFKDGNKIMVPEAQIYLTRENRTLTTDINGTVIAHSILPNVSYTLNASRYGVSFNVTSFSTLLVDGNAVAWYAVPFICPVHVLRVNVADANSVSISDVKVKVQELLGGLLYEGNTSMNGMAEFNCAFGKYRIEVFDLEGIKLNETTTDVFYDRNVTIYCKLWNLSVSIKIVDYFGQPISNVNITLLRQGLALSSKLTGSDGAATFNRVTGGSLQVAIYLFDEKQPYMTTFFSADGSATIPIKLEEYVVLAGFFIETSILITAIIIIASVIAVLLVEIYRRRHFKQKPTSS